MPKKGIITVTTSNQVGLRSSATSGEMIVSAGRTVRTFALLILVPGLLGAAKARCANQIVDVSHSPNGRFKAVVFVRACSDPARFSTQVSILKSKRKLSNIAGNVFMCDGSYGLSPSSSERPRVSVAWNADDRLVLRYPSEAKVFVAKNLLKGVQIEYEPELLCNRTGTLPCAADRHEPGST